MARCFSYSSLLHSAWGSNESGRPPSPEKLSCVVSFRLELFTWTIPYFEVWKNVELLSCFVDLFLCERIELRVEVIE